MKILIPPSEGKANIKKPFDIKFGDTEFPYMDDVRRVIRLLGLIGENELKSIYGTSKAKALLFPRQNQDAMQQRELAEKARSLKNLSFGEVNKFMHTDIGFNYRMPNIEFCKTGDGCN